MAELVDALVSGTSEVTLVEVRVLFAAPRKSASLSPEVFFRKEIIPEFFVRLLLFRCKNPFSQPEYRVL